MNVQGFARLSRLIVLATVWIMLDSAMALADPLYTAVDLGTGNLSYGVNSSGVGTVTGSSGLTYAFSPVQNYLPAQWMDTTKGVPTVNTPPTSSPDTYGNPNFAYSYSNLAFMNQAGLAAGINYYGVDGHLGNGEVFMTQSQPNGGWGGLGGLWSGSQGFGGPGSSVGILGVAANGQVLGWGTPDAMGMGDNTMYLYDSKTRSFTNLTNLIDSIKWTNSRQFPLGADPNWFLQSPLGQLDNQGRILVQATQGYGNYMSPWDNVLLVPEGLSADPLATPEPTTCAIFATLIGGWMAQRWARSRGRS